jgi:XTP/dITP diphosphohydrolase
MNETSSRLTLLIATHNAHKVGEIRTILGEDFCYLTLNDFPDAPKVVEDADTFAGNATKKAVELAKWLNTSSSAPRHPLPSHVLADDSGLDVDALNGAPGVHSARFAALATGQTGNSADLDNSSKLLRLLQDVPAERRTARFRCVIALVRVKSKSEVSDLRLFEGACEGRIIFAPRGQGGFGYDPLFVPVGFDETFAELGEDVKNRLSHRALALQQLKTALAQ